MNIVHFCLSCFYIDGYAYQENQLVAEHVRAGYSVTVIASTDSFGEDKLPCFVDAGDYIGTDGARVIRLPYRSGLPVRVMAKLRSYPGVMKLLENIRPDVIVFHGLCAWELLTVNLYVKRNPSVRLYADCHEDFNNSARGFFSKWILHYAFYRTVFQFCLPRIKNVWSISVESEVFAKKFYGVPSEKSVFMPLGGYIYNDDEYNDAREGQRRKLSVSDDGIIFLQSGKMDEKKKLAQSLRAFAKVPGDHHRFFLTGKIMPDILDEVGILLSADARVINLGWVQPEQLRVLLCAADVYVQPGSQSATMQMSLCCRCAVIIADVPSHHVFYRRNGFLVTDEIGLEQAMMRIAIDSRKSLHDMKSLSKLVADELLDYKKQAERLATV